MQTLLSSVISWSVWKGKKRAPTTCTNRTGTITQNFTVIRRFYAFLPGSENSKPLHQIKRISSILRFYFFFILGKTNGTFQTMLIQSNGSIFAMTSNRYRMNDGQDKIAISGVVKKLVILALRNQFFVKEDKMSHLKNFDTISTPT